MIGKSCTEGSFRVRGIVKAEPNFSVRRSLRLATLVTLLSLAACGAPPKYDPQRVSLDMRSFSEGAVVMSCSSVGCAGSFGAKRRLLLQLYRSRNWERLANEVVALNYDIDLSYFYLGQAALGMSKYKAAVTYYQLGLYADQKCAGVIDVCDGFKVPELLQAGVDIAGSAASEEERQAARLRDRLDSVPPVAPQPPTYRYPVTNSPGQQGSVKFSGTNVGAGGHTLLLRAWRTRAGETLYQLYVAVNYNGLKRSYSSAVDSHGNTLRFIPAAVDSRNCTGNICQYTEHIAITLPKSYLIDNQSNGIKLKLRFDRGSMAVNLGPNYVQDFLAQVP